MFVGPECLVCNITVPAGMKSTKTFAAWFVYMRVCALRMAEKRPKLVANAYMVQNFQHNLIYCCVTS